MRDNEINILLFTELLDYVKLSSRNKVSGINASQLELVKILVGDTVRFDETDKFLVICIDIASLIARCVNANQKTAGSAVCLIQLFFSHTHSIHTSKRYDYRPFA